MRYITADGGAAAFLKSLKHCVKDVRLWPTARNPTLAQTSPRKIPKDLLVGADKPAAETLTQLFFLPITGVFDVQAAPASIAHFIGRMKRPRGMQALGVLLTCPAIYGGDVAGVFTTALHNRIHFAPTLAENIRFALHEALVNGLVHGNLDMDSSLRQSAQDFARYSRLLADRLNDPAYAHKAIEMSARWNKQRLEIKIRDEGAGYRIGADFKARAAPAAKSGRGLKMIAGSADACTIDDYGREITLTFLFNEPAVGPAVEAAPAVSDFSRCRVLIIDDDPSTQTVLARLLDVLGVGSADIAGSGRAGLERIKSCRPDLVILDLTMPGMDGYGVMQKIKSDPATRDIPILIQTASDNRETREKTFRAGAVDFISKPINPLEFFARVRVQLENRLLIQKLQTQLDQIDAELQAANRMQVGLLPSPESLADIRAKYRLDIAHAFVPSSALGGDFWQVLPISDTQAAVYLCDFSGHGVAASLNTIRLHTLVAGVRAQIKSPLKFLRFLNAHLYDLLPPGQFATFFFGIIDTREKTLTYASAGAPPPLLGHGKSAAFLPSSGMPLGLQQCPKYTLRTVRFGPSDSLFLFSDALPENPNAQGKRLGHAGVKKMAAPILKKGPAQKALDAIVRDFFAFSPPPPADDVTAVLIRMLPE
ncbi:MAG: SpoIIE family protein phosphatase [Alphaproteobacteria bacterium]|nr:SpoIIE family protein phosphatase [Alphaproteobacteria bacterium]